ncbi:MAG: branched-chain amino acid aminotransferase [Bacteroidia bacterium]|nr:branched-chain amino acid aminotransferase [Bacteroidia bacterium]
MIRITPTPASQLGNTDFSKLEFGKYVSDHMFIAHYRNGQWDNGEIIPFQNIPVSPAALALHYGQSVFEGMKAFRMNSGPVSIFRIPKHLERLNRSLERMCMQPVPAEMFREAVETLVKTDIDWVPPAGEGSLYLRPFVFASESRYGVKVSDEFTFIIFSGPVGPYYPKPLRVKVETLYSRAARGGTGAAKCAGNYGASFYPTRMAQQEGFDAVIWTDGQQHEYIEESGTMNVMFVDRGTLITPELTDSILPGITRDSILQLARKMQIDVREYKIPVQELKQKLADGSLTEAFGTGTAAVVAPIKSISIDGEEFTLPDATDDSLMFRLRNALNELRTEGSGDTFGWNTILS